MKEIKKVIKLRDKNDLDEVKNKDIAPREEIKTNTPKEPFKETALTEQIIRYLNFFEISAASRKLIDKNSYLEVKIPPALRQDLADGKLEFLKDKSTDELMPILLNTEGKKTSNILRLDLKKGPSETSLNNFLSATAKIIDQQRYENLDYLLDTLINLTTDISNKLDDKTYDLIKNGKRQLDLYQAVSESHDKERYLNLAEEVVSRGLDEIILVIESDFKSLDPIPANRLGRFNYIMENTKAPDIKKLSLIKEHVSYYLMALDQLVYIYQQRGYTEAIENIFIANETLFSEDRLDLLK